MLKEEVILVRIDQELKEKIKKFADKLGLSLSAYIRMTIKKDISNACQ